jgi:hypothetical protein
MHHLNLSLFMDGVLCNTFSSQGGRIHGSPLALWIRAVGSCIRRKRRAGARESVDGGLGYGNVGGQALERHAETIKTALTAVKEAIQKTSDSIQTKPNVNQEIVAD